MRAVGVLIGQDVLVHSPLGEPFVSVVDHGVLAGLERDLGAREVVREVVQLFLEQLSHRRPAVLDAAAAGDLLGVRRAAHTLGSASAIVGAVELLGLCRELEACRLTGPALAAAPLLATWSRSCTETEFALTDWLAAP